MAAPRVPSSEQYRLVMECRQSGLSDHQWCMEQGIKPGTFYNWVRRLKQKGITDIPESAGHDNYHPTPKQEVVRIDPRPETEPFCGTPSGNIYAPAAVQQLEAPTLELAMGNTVLRLTNDVDPQLLIQTIRLLKGFSC